MRIGMICWAGTGNIGDAMMQEALSAQLNERLHATITLLTYAITEDRPDEQIRSLWHDTQTAIEEQDVLLLGPGGLLPGMALQDTWCSPECQLPSEWFSEKPAFGVSLGYTPGCTTHPDAMQKTAEYLKPLRWVWSRDTILYDMVHSTLRECYPDVSYLVPGLVSYRARSPHTGRGALAIPFGSDCQANKRLAVLCNDYSHGSANGVTIMPVSWSAGENDWGQCLAVQDMADDPFINGVSDPISWRDFATMASLAEVVLSCRVHPCIIADAIGTRYVSLDAMRKFRAMEWVNYSNGSVRPPEDVGDTIRRAQQGMDELIRRIEEVTA